MKYSKYALIRTTVCSAVVAILGVDSEAQTWRDIEKDQGKRLTTGYYISGGDRSQGIPSRLFAVTGFHFEDYWPKGAEESVEVVVFDIVGDIDNSGYWEPSIATPAVRYESETAIPALISPDEPVMAYKSGEGEAENWWRGILFDVIPEHRE